MSEKDQSGADLRVARAETDHCRVLLDINQIDWHITLQQETTTCPLSSTVPLHLTQQL